MSQSPGGHKDLLQLYCRICGKRSVSPPTIATGETPLAGLNGVSLAPNPTFRSFLSRLHDVDVEHESSEIFPKKVCQRCVQRLRSVRVTFETGNGETSQPEVARLSVFDLVDNLYVHRCDDDLRHLARKFAVADFWAHSSSSFQQCGVCDDVSTTHNIVSSGVDTISTCHIVVRQVDTENEWGDVSKSYKIVDIRDVDVPFRQDRNDVTTEGGVKRSHSQSDGATSDGASDVKKLKVDVADKANATSSASSSTSASPAKPSAASALYQNIWPEFTSTLGKNRKYRSDKLSEILNQYLTEMPKVISDLKSSGMTFDASKRKSHFVKNDEFRKHVSMLLAMLQKVPTSKKSLLMFRAISDTASDGQLNILAHVGIDIDLSNPNLGFLLRRIQNRASAVQQQQQQQPKPTPPAPPQQQQQQPKPKQPHPKVQKSPAKTAGTARPGSSGRQLLSSSLTISKVRPPADSVKPKSVNSSAVRPTAKTGSQNKVKKPSSRPTDSPAAKAPVVTITPVEAQAVAPLKLKVSSAAGKPASKATPAKLGGLLPNKSASSSKPKKKLPELKVKEELFDDANINRILLQTKIRQLNQQIPVNRQMKADIVRDVLLRRNDTKDLMVSHGILFDPEGGNYHLKALDQQRGNGRKKFEKLTSSLNIYEWRACIASMVYDLLHPEDSLTLRIVGIFIDPTHEKVPLHFRLNFALKRTLLMSPLSAAIMNHLYDNVQVLATGKDEIEAWETGLVELLYCDRKDAAKLLQAGKNDKYSAGLKVPPLVISKAKNAVTPAQTKAKSAAIAKNAIIKTEPMASRSPVIVQLRPKKGSVSSAGKSNNPKVLIPRLTKTSPKNAASRSKKKADDSSFSSKARPAVSDGSRSSRRATRKRTEQRIHEVAKLESMSDNEFEEYPAGSGPNPMPSQAPHLDMEQDPLFDPLSIPDDGPAPGQIQTEAFMQNMVEIKTEILDDYPVEETGSQHEMDIQDDLEVNHREVLDERSRLQDENSGHETEEEVVEGLSNGLEGLSTPSEDQHDQPTDDFHAEENSLTEDMNPASNDNDDVAQAVAQNYTAADDDNQFSELRITSVEGSATTTSESVPSPTPNYDDIVSGAVAAVVDKPNGFASEQHSESGLGEYNETEMQQLESLEEMLSFAQSTVAEPPASVDATVSYGFSQFDVGENSQDENVGGGESVGLQVTNSFSFSKESFDDHEVSDSINESVDLILQEVAGEISSASFDPLN